MTECTSKLLRKTDLIWKQGDSNQGDPSKYPVANSVDLNDLN